MNGRLPPETTVADVAFRGADPKNAEFAERIVGEQSSAFGINGCMLEAMLLEIGYPISPPNTFRMRNVRQAICIEETLKRRKLEKEHEEANKV